MQAVFHRVCVVLLVAILPFFFWWGPGNESARIFQQLWNLGHSFFFCLLTLYIFFHESFCRMAPLGRAISCLVLTMLLGGTIELVQYFIPERVSSISDILLDVAGSMIALFFITIKAAKSNFIRVTGILCSSAILALPFFSLIGSIRDEIVAWREFPSLADFEHEYDLHRWELGDVQVARVSSPVRTGRFALKIDFSTKKYSWIAFTRFPRDWSGYAAICFSMYNPGEPIKLHFRVHDTLHREPQEYTDRYNKQFFLDQGWNDIRVDMYDILNAPQGRLMDLNNIQGIVFFVMEQKVGRTLYLDSLRLE